MEIREVPRPAIRAGEVLVRMDVAALCGSDLHLFRGAEPFDRIAGHENAGHVVESRSSRLSKGQQVILYALRGCLRCQACREGNRMYCADLDYVIGGFAEYVAVREDECLPLPEWMTLEGGAVFGDGVGLAWHTLRRLSAEAGGTVLIIGLGPAGLGMTMMAKAMGMEVIGIETNAFRRGLASELGADHVLDPAQADSESRVLDLTDGIGPDFAIDCAGRDVTQLACMRLCRKGGAVALVGGNTSLSLNPNELFLARELRVTGNWYFNIREFEEIADFAHGRLDPARLVTHTFALTEAQQAFDLFASGDCGKVVLRPE